MSAADDYSECAAISSRMAEALPDDQERWLAIAARYGALATRAREARTPQWSRKEDDNATAPADAPVETADEAQSDDDRLQDVIAEAKGIATRFSVAQCSGPSGQFLQQSRRAQVLLTQSRAVSVPRPHRDVTGPPASSPPASLDCGYYLRVKDPGPWVPLEVSGGSIPRIP
jgi:hypothetical protein